MAGMCDYRNERRTSANPMFCSLPAEVTSRRQHRVKKVVEADGVRIDIEAALALRPESRVKWLQSALDMVKDGKSSSRELFNIITQRKFSSALPQKVGRKLCSLAQENASLFSDNQQINLFSQDFLLNSKYGPEPEEKRSDGGSSAEDDIAGPEHIELAAPDRRCRSRSRRPEQRERTDRVDRGRDRDLPPMRDRSEPRSARREPELQPQKAPLVEEHKRAAVEMAFKGQTSRTTGLAQAAKALEGQLGRAQLEQQERQRKQEADADNSLELLLGRRNQPEEQEETVDQSRGHSRRCVMRSRSPALQTDDSGARGQHRRRRRRRSRSRSISIQAASMSPSPPAQIPRSRGSGGGRKSQENFQDAVARRMAQREASDSTRNNVTWSREDLRSGRHKESRTKWLNTTGGTAASTIGARR